LWKNNTINQERALDTVFSLSQDIRLYQLVTYWRNRQN
jgi:hypothetical protein